MISWIKQAWADLTQWFIAIFNAVVDFFTDLPVLLLESFLDAILYLIQSIPVPDFLSNGMSAFMAGIPSDIFYFLSMSGFDNALAVLGAGVSFRLLRKLFTLGQW
jgi:hypothetical protein